jgi:hypothetical protein
VAPESSFNVVFDVVNIGADMPAPADIVADVYIAGQPDLNGPHAFLQTFSVSGQQLDNTDVSTLGGLVTLPFGVSGPHYILVEIDVAGAVPEGNESNLFVLGAIDVN